MTTERPIPDGSDGSAMLQTLRATRARIKRVLLVERLAQALAFGLVAVVAAVVLDRVLRLPPAVRVLELLLLLGGGIAWFVTRVLPAIRFAPPLVEVALRMERGHGDARGILAAGADLAGADVAAAEALANPVTGQLAQEVVRRASTVVQHANHGIVDPRPARRASMSAGVAAVIFAAMVLLSPESARIALLRLATPFADVQWPARTMVEPAMASKVHPRGSALPLRARTVRGEPASMRVEAQYRLVRDGAGEWRTVLLSAQPDGSFERLVETDGDAIEVLFRTEDMETLPVTVRLVQAPAVESARASIDPPAYAQGAVDARAVDLGNGTDRRATVSPPVLAGSQITMQLSMRGTIEPPSDVTGRAAWLDRTVSIMGVDGRRISPEFTVDAAKTAAWTLRWSASGRGVIELKPEGAEGIVPTERIAFEIPAIDDTAPVIAIIEPAADESVTPEATPLVVAEGRDDLSVKRIWLEVSVGRGKDDPRNALTADGTPGVTARVERTVSIKDVGAQAGDRVICIARAVDAFESEGKPRNPVASTPRVFRIISPTELSEQVRSRLGQMRDAAGRLREEQAGIAEAARNAAERTEKEGAAATEQERSQLAGTEGRMADRVAAFERSLAELSSRLERNKTDGDGLDKTIADAAKSAQAATQQAQQAASAMPKPGTDAAKDAAERAAESERSLADLETALQRDRETAELSRRIDRLAEKLDAARRDTKAAGEKSMGKDRQQLGEEARAQLDRAAQAQREAAAEARSLSEDLGKRAEEVQRRQDADPGAAEAMKEAQREADERGLARQLEQAAQQTEQNKMQAAQQSQQQAQQAVQAMQQAMRNQQKKRNEELERRVTEVVDALRALLGQIEEHSLPMQQLVAEDTVAVERESKAMLRLSQNASGITESAMGAGQSLRRAATLVARAAEQLDESATALRKAPPEPEPARGSLEAARKSVQEALASAEQAKREADRAAENRRREELRGVYQQVLERQQSARAGTESIVPAPGKSLDRRGFIESRRIAAEQAAVTNLLTAVAKRADVSGSELYSSSNDEMVAASNLASQDLSSSSVSRRTVMVQKEVEASIAALMEALSDPPEAEDPFAQGANKEQKQGESGGGGGGQQPGGQRVPPMAELRLLRTMAQRVLDDTAAASELPEGDRAAYLARVAQRQKRIMDLGERWMNAMKEQSGAPKDGQEQDNGGAGSQQPPSGAPKDGEIP